jgi:hypothetical protein
MGQHGQARKMKTERGITGKELNREWKVGARHALYRETGNWFQLLKRFPGALFDANGYILFETKQDYEQCEFLQRGKEIGVPRGIASIKGYVTMRPKANREQRASSRDLEAIVAELGRQAVGYEIGELQSIRAEIKGIPLPKSDSARRLFGKTHTNLGGDYAFHYRGGSELQFNIGLEPDGGKLRYGVAFSFEPSQSKPWPALSETLRPKVVRFNEFLTLNAGLFGDMRMWHDDKNRRIGGDEMPGPIPWERADKKGVFVFLGKRQDVSRIDYESVLNDLDRLLPLYKYVESRAATEPTLVPSPAPFVFCPQVWTEKAAFTIATQVQRQLDVALRHNEMQKALYDRLVSQYGQGSVTFENPSGVGTRVDVVVQRENEYWFYEIKTAQTPRACLREAIGQLLEYAFWPGAPNVTRLVVVGETPIDNSGAVYLRCLRERFSLPLEYEQIPIR